MKTDRAYLPIIQKTKDGELVHIEERCFQKVNGELHPITKAAFEALLHGREMITWDGEMGVSNA